MNSWESKDSVNCPDPWPAMMGPHRLDDVALILGTGYDRFGAPSGIDGLARVRGDHLELLAVFARQPGRGQLREFIRQAKGVFQVIHVWEIWNADLGATLLRYGFTPDEQVESCGEHVRGLRWERGNAECGMRNAE